MNGSLVFQFLDTRLVLSIGVYKCGTEQLWPAIWTQKVTF